MHRCGLPGLSCMQVCTYTHIHMHTRTHVRMHIRTHACMHTHTHTHIHTHTHTHTHTHVHLHVCTYMEFCFQLAEWQLVQKLVTPTLHEKDMEYVKKMWRMCFSYSIGIAWIDISLNPREQSVVEWFPPCKGLGGC